MNFDLYIYYKWISKTRILFCHVHTLIAELLAQKESGKSLILSDQDLSKAINFEQIIVRKKNAVRLILIRKKNSLIYYIKYLEKLKSKVNTRDLGIPSTFFSEHLNKNL